MSLTTCLKRAGSALNADDKAAIIGRSRALRGEGKSASDAARTAVQEQLDAVRAMLPVEEKAAKVEQAPAQAEPVKAAAPTDNSLVEAGKMLRSFDAYGRIDALAGDSRSGIRRDVMSALLGRKATRAESGINAVQSEFYRRLGIEGGTLNSQMLRFGEWIKSLDDAGNVKLFSLAADDAPPFYSELARHVERSPMNAGQPSAWLSWLKGLPAKGVKPDEIAWTGIEEWLGMQTGKVTKQAVADFLGANGVKVTETVLGGAMTVEKRGGSWVVAGADGVVRSTHSRQDEARANAEQNTEPVKYGQYQLPGGSNYREVLLTLPSQKDALVRPLADATRAWRDAVEEFGPDSEQARALRAERTHIDKERDAAPHFKSVHWDVPNVLAHLRVNDRVDADGKRVLFVEEIQSDWAQDGKKKGFTLDPMALRVQRKRELEYIQDSLMLEARSKLGPSALTTSYTELARELGREVELQSAREAVSAARNEPGLAPAPFVQKTDAWVALALKRVIKMAVDEGYDRVAFIRGGQSAERYDLSKQISSIGWWKTPEGQYGFTAEKDGQRVIKENGITADRLSEVLGKDIAEKIVGGVGKSEWASKTYGPKEAGQLSGLDLKVGGEGMRAFYDKIVPSVLKDVLRKVGGGAMGTVNVPIGEDFKTRSRAEAERDGGSFGRVAVPIMGAQPGFTITEAMREKAAGGLPLFSVDPGDGAADTPSRGTEPASPKHRAAVADLASSLSRDFGRPVVLDAVAPGSTGLGRGPGELETVSRLSRELFGRDVAVVRFLGKPAFDGAVWDQRPGLIFLNANSRRPLMAILGHELLHQLRAADPRLYDDLNRRLGELRKDEGRYRDMLKERYERQGMELPNKWLEELNADIVGDFFMDKQFWRDLGAKDKTLLQRIGDAVLKLLDDVSQWVLGNRPLGTAEYLKDIDAARAAVVDAMHAFSLRSQHTFFDGEGKSFSVAPAGKTDSEAFRRWFGDSKVVDAQGKPLVVYHGAPDARFINEDGIFKTLKEKYGDADPDGRAFWFAADRSTAATYADDSRAFDYQNAEAGVVAVYLALKNPLIIDANGQQWREAQRRGKTSDVIAEAKAGGHDGAIIRNVADRYNDNPGDATRRRGRGPQTTDTFVVFTSNQIKSATGNRGTFDPANPDIRFSLTPGGSPPAANTPQQLTQIATAVGPRWRDAAGRFQFAPGQWLYDRLGDAASPLLERIGMKAASPELRRQMREMNVQVQKAQEAAVGVAKAAAQFSEAERALVSDLIEKHAEAGTVPPEHAVRMAERINGIMSTQTDELVRLGMLSKESAERWRGEYLPRFYKSKMRQSVDPWMLALRKMTGRPAAMKGIGGKSLNGRGLWETVPSAEIQKWQGLGWEVRDPEYKAGESTEAVMWRDYTRAEREKMGEIRDFGFRFVMGYTRTQRDIALGRMFEAMAKDPALSSKSPRDGWVQVPDTAVPGTMGVKRYGALAGRWVPRDVISHLSKYQEADNEALKMYRAALGAWKEGKTALNPVAHFNNIVSNLSMAHFAGVSYWDAHKYAAAITDLATKAPMVQEAKDAGLFLGTISTEELSQMLPKELQALAQQQRSGRARAATFAFNALALGLRRPLGVAYQAEDLFFRYLIYRDARKNGTAPADAVDHAQRFIFTYDDLPKGARIARDTLLPFFAYTYKAFPALLHTALTHPHRLLAPASVLWGINALSYALAEAGDDEDWYEAAKKYLTNSEFRAAANKRQDEERKNLPPWMKGASVLLSPKAIRLGMDELTGLPLFLDAARIIPGGDLFDVNANAGGLPIIQPLTPNHPALTTFSAMIGNKDLFTGKGVTDANDTSTEAAEKRALWLWKQFTPAIAVGNAHWDRGVQAVANMTGQTVTWWPNDATGIGKDGQPVQPKHAAMQTFGLKIKPYDLDVAEDIDQSQRNKLMRDIDAEMAAMRRMNQKGAISDKQYDAAFDRADIKKDRIKDGLTVDGEPVK